jgi:hypothetical protein
MIYVTQLIYVRPGKETEFETHFVSFETEDDLERYSRDDQRQRFLHLKNESVRSALVVRGTALS